MLPRTWGCNRYPPEVNLQEKLELLDKQIAAAKNGFPEDFDTWRNQSEVLLRTLLGGDSPLRKNFLAIRYTPSMYYSGMDTSGYRPAGVKKAMTVLEAAKLELKLTSQVDDVVAEEPPGSEKASGAPLSNRVFIVHGHDGERKHELARLLQDLTSEKPVILHEASNKGRILIEKFEDSAVTTGYAVVLLTADDLGRAKGDSADKPRGRQNVVFEMGFFFGALGRDRVAVLYEDGVELPGDVTGLVYIPLDDGGGWKTKIAGELDEAGLAIEWKALK